MKLNPGMEYLVDYDEEYDFGRYIVMRSYVYCADNRWFMHTIEMVDDDPDDILQESLEEITEEDAEEAVMNSQEVEL